MIYTRQIIVVVATLGLLAVAFHSRDSVAEFIGTTSFILPMYLIMYGIRIPNAIENFFTAKNMVIWTILIYVTCWGAIVVCCAKQVIHFYAREYREWKNQREQSIRRRNTHRD